MTLDSIEVKTKSPRNVILAGVRVEVETLRGGIGSPLQHLDGHKTLLFFKEVALDAPFRSLFSCEGDQLVSSVPICDASSSIGAE